MRKLILTIFLVVVVFANEARDIMVKVDDRDDGSSQINDMIMVLIDKNKKQRVRELKSYTKDKGEDTQKILFFLSPADVKNTAFLTYDYDDSKKDDDQWLYLPALKKTKRIPTSDKSSSFMGSDFTYSDMTRRNLEDYDYKLLKTSKVRGNRVWIIEATPRTTEVIDETGYKKSILFVRQDNFVVVRAIHFLEKGKKKKYLDIKKLKKINGIWVTEEMTMTLKLAKTTLHKTIIKNSNIEINTPIEDRMFTVRRLEKGI